MTSQELQALIDLHSDDSLAEVEGGHVWQVFQDGEVALQKCGSLLGQRILHTIYPGFPGFDAGCVWPHQYRSEAKYIYTSERGAKAIHRAIAAMVGKHSYCGEGVYIGPLDENWALAERVLKTWPGTPEELGVDLEVATNRYLELTREGQLSANQRRASARRRIRSCPGGAELLDWEEKHR